MTAKKIIISTFALLLSALILIGTVNFCIDPLFQYHKPWFNMEPCITNERYQNAGVAKNLDFENVIIGNSMSENFIVSDVEKLFGGTTVKLTASGSHNLDWAYLLNILNKREDHPKNILINFDPGFFDASPEVMQFELPEYLYDYNYFNDFEYLYNFALLKEYTLNTVLSNITGNIPNYDTAFVWSKENDCGKDIVLATYTKDSQQKQNKEPSDTFFTDKNLLLTGEYIQSMQDTQFVFFTSPFSILYWKDKYDEGRLDDYKMQFEKSFTFFSQYDNVTVYFWTDTEMLNIISNLENYKDAQHYGFNISKEIIKRMENNIGILPKEEKSWQSLLDTFFDFLESYDYEKIFE